jgi:glycosyltransferase involved in cell wall biosynthesis
MVPSKLQGSFTAGRPILFVGSKTSSLGQWITESGGGWVIPPDDSDSLHQAIKEALDRSERQSRSERALAYSSSHFDLKWSRKTEPKGK